MGAQEKASVLLKHINENIDVFDRRRSNNKWRALFFRLSVIGMSATVTILLGLKLEGASNTFWAQTTALIFSACVTGISALEGLYNPRGLWIRYTGAVNELKVLKMKVEYLVARGIKDSEDSDIDSLQQNFHHILEDIRSQWIKLRKESEKKNEEKA